MDQEQLDTLSPEQEEERLKVPDSRELSEHLAKILPNGQDPDSQSYKIGYLKDIVFLEIQIDKERQNMRHRDLTVKAIIRIMIGIFILFCFSVLAKIIIEPIFWPNRQIVSDNLIGKIADTLLFGGGGGIISILIMRLWPNTSEEVDKWRDKFDRKLNQK